MNAKAAREYTDDCKLLNLLTAIKEACREGKYEVEVTQLNTETMLLDKLKKLKYGVKVQGGYTLISW